ncbi:hypothetical protein ACP179_01760 (plasmid) [Xenorhabdus stockiae]|uniref:hypothetical protein n=1 Tax=Xenorhabdus stockiae TaxID=351614 RepID=UPI003CEE2379
MNDFSVEGWRHVNTNWDINDNTNMLNGWTAFRNYKLNGQIFVKWEKNIDATTNKISVVEVNCENVISGVTSVDEVISAYSVILKENVGQKLMNTIDVIIYNTDFNKCSVVNNYFFCYHMTPAENESKNDKYIGSHLCWNTESVNNARNILAKDPLIGFVTLKCRLSFKDRDIYHMDEFIKISRTHAYVSFLSCRENSTFKADVTELVFAE